MKHNDKESIEIEIIRSERKTISLEITRDLRVILRAPIRARKAEIDRFISEKSDWLEKNLQKMKKQFDPANNKSLFKDYPPDKIRELAEDASIYIPVRAKYFSEIMGVSYGRITIRCQKTRWGSCSSKGNLNFNCLLMLCPKEVIDYVVVHELAHRKELNHSKAFWNEVERIIPDYSVQRKWLKDHS